jgi:phospholipase/carboxylesterase
VWATGGEDRQGGGDGPAILLCHGFGAPGDDLVSLARVTPVDRGVRWFFPEALLEIDFGMGMKGRAWWPIDMMRLQEAMQRGEARLLAKETPEGLSRAREALTATLAELERTHGVRRERTILGGFSQGAMLATELALFSPDRPFAGLAILSGTLLSEERWAEAAKTAGPGIHAVMSHGRRDPILPFGGAEALLALLEGAGAHVRFVPHQGQHEIPEAALAGLVELARERFGVS